MAMGMKLEINALPRHVRHVLDAEQVEHAAFGERDMIDPEPRCETNCNLVQLGR